MSPEVKHDAAVQIANSAPAATFVGLTFAGVPIQDWVALLGGVFILVQVGYLIWKWQRDAKIERDRQDDRQARLEDDE
jgi:hypothetical protein